VGLAASLALLELGVRVFDVGPTFHVVYREIVRASDDPALGYELRPGARDGPDRISATGLRDGEHPLAKPPGVFRILAVGDSVTYGLGLPRDAAWPAVLERILNERARPGAPRFEVLNLGVPGYHVEQVVGRLAALGLAHQPDLVVYGYVLNDPQGTSLKGQAIASLREQAEGRDAGGAARLLAHSRLFLLLRHWWTTAPDSPAKDLPPDPLAVARASGRLDAYVRELHQAPESRARLERGLDGLAALSRREGLPTLVAVFPLLEEGERRDGDPVADVHEALAAALAARGLPAFDLQQALFQGPGVRRLRLDVLHPNAAGYRVVAAALFGALCEQRLLPPDTVACDPGSE
jgi:lysophospholipase L1-like esterase